MEGTQGRRVQLLEARGLHWVGGVLVGLQGAQEFTTLWGNSSSLRWHRDLSLLRICVM